MPRGASRRLLFVPDSMHPMLSATDASLLLLEDRPVPMVGSIGAVLLFDEPLPAREEVVAQLEARLDRCPRLRHRLHGSALPGARPHWAPDPSFDLGRHVVAHPPTGAAAVRDRAAAEFDSPLPRERPLWRLALLPGRDEPGVAVWVMHHAMADGVSLVDLLDGLFGASGGPPAPYRAGRRPTDRLESARLGMRGLKRLATEKPGPPAGHPGLNRAIDEARQVRWVHAPLERLREVQSAAGGTLNDVYLAVVARALGAWLDVRDGDTAAEVLVPVSVRRDGERGRLGNRILGITAPLPLAERDPRRQLRLVSERMGEAKTDGQLEVARIVLFVESGLPTPLLGAAARLHAAEELSNVMASNVVGPAEPLVLGGRTVRHVVPVNLLPDRHAASFWLISYAGEATIGLLTDGQADADGLERCTEQALADLHRAALGAGGLPLGATPQ